MQREQRHEQTMVKEERRATSEQRAAGQIASPPHDGRSRVVIESVSPELDAGVYAVKRVLGDRVTVEVDLIGDGHEIVAGEVLVRPPAPTNGAEAAEHVVPLSALGNDRYAASFEVTRIGRWHYTVRAWIDHFATWRRGLERKLEARQDIDVDLLIGWELVSAAAKRATGDDHALLHSATAALAERGTPADERARAALRPELAAVMARNPDRAYASTGPRWLPLWVDREKARFSTWYEMFPRSTAQDGRHGTFHTAMARLPYVAAMGFDVIYLPPIHPIGHTFRKGKNNATVAAEGDVGSPWAIGDKTGGHKSVHPELGTLDDFDAFVRRAVELGLEVALDIAFQVTPDHPYVEQHPEWFKRRPDGTIQYAENPPKKYQDIYPFDFESEDWWGLWQELKSIFDFWIARGVRIFRVDNPHTKSLRFWRWCIEAITAEHPDVIFLAEAFTRPKLMYALAKLGFTQSYTYFTWRNTAQELREYLRELSTPPVSDFFRPNLWPTTPDILPEHLQYAGRSAFALRLVLAATLSGNYGVYGPAFELMDNVPRGEVEEYGDNEKYELKRWDIGREDSLRPLITRINAIRRDNAALQHGSLLFHRTDNELLLCYSRHAADGQSSILVVVNMDVHHPQSGWVELELPPAVATEAHDLQLHDLLSDARYFSEGRRLFVRLDPGSAPAHVFRLRRRTRREHDFDYFA